MVITGHKRWRSPPMAIKSGGSHHWEHKGCLRSPSGGIRGGGGDHPRSIRDAGNYHLGAIRDGGGHHRGHKGCIGSSSKGIKGSGRHHPRT